MKEILLHPFALGFYTGCIFLALALYHQFQLKFELARLRRMLTDKMEIEATAIATQKGELEILRKENENLRIKVQTLSAQPDQKLGRDLEIFARAEKKMTVAAPGFAAPWEQAKQAAWQELGEEESGRASSRTLFQRFFCATTGNGEQVRALPQTAEPTKQGAPGAS